jgi:hypothetical protein
MEMFYGGGGNQYPDFRFKVRILKNSSRVNEMLNWCDNYPTGDHGYFKRYYVDWRGGTTTYDNDWIVFQFEWEEPAIMFALSFGDELA